jgi:hypothetical protein
VTAQSPWRVGAPGGGVPAGCQCQTQVGINRPRGSTPRTLGAVETATDCVCTRAAAGGEVSEAGERGERVGWVLGSNPCYSPWQPPAKVSHLAQQAGASQTRRLDGAGSGRVRRVGAGARWRTGGPAGNPCQALSNRLPAAARSAVGARPVHVVCQPLLDGAPGRRRRLSSCRPGRQSEAQEEQRSALEPQARAATDAHACGSAKARVRRH